MEQNKINCLDHGFVKLLNISGATRRIDNTFDARDIDPAICARISFDNFEEERTEEQDLALCEYLIKNRHSSPIEFTEVWFEFKLPIFVARQTMRHRTFVYNEVSGRYSKLPKEFYIPDIVGGKGGNNKQGQIDNLTQETQEWFKTSLQKQGLESYNLYEKALDNGVANEHARLVLHLNTYTHYICKANLSNWFHFLSLRLHGHAQIETRLYAQAVYDLLEKYLPESIKNFDKYIRIS
jgi:thymidylate synthase (FAD)